MIKFRLCGQLYRVRVADLRQVLTRITADLWRGGAEIQAQENNQ